MKAQVLTIRTSASSAFRVTSMPWLTMSPSMISASTRFFAHPRLIIPTFRGEASASTSVAVSGRIMEFINCFESVDDDITGIRWHNLPILSDLNHTLIQNVHPEAFPPHHNAPILRSFKPLQARLPTPLFYLNLKI